MSSASTTPPSRWITATARTGSRRIVKPRETGFRRMWMATIYSVQGIRAAWIHETAFRQECIFGLILLPIAFVIAENWAASACWVENDVTTPAAIADCKHS